MEGRRRTNGDGEGAGAAPGARLAPRLLRRRRRRGAGHRADPRYAAPRSSFLLLLAAMLWLVDYALPAPGGCSSGQSVLLVAFVVAGMDLISRADPSRPWEDERAGGWGERDQLFNTDASTLPLLIHERTTFSSVHNQFHPGKGHD